MMATAETAPAPHDRSTRRRPFQWMRRLANLKSSTASPHRQEKKHHNGVHKGKNQDGQKRGNNPYPESGHFNRRGPPATGPNGRLSFSTPISDDASGFSSIYSGPSNGAPLRSKSNAPTLATNAETIHSDAGVSKAGTSNTVGGGQSSRDGGANSTFSSPNHSDRSLTTTLTTIQSTAPSAFLNTMTIGSIPLATTSNAGSMQNNSSAFSPYPASPASAVPAHLQAHTYSGLTANNMLSDDASILTLASSSKRRRRHSLDTNASVRALAPSSLWGGSRESLPLSVLSGTGGVAPGDGSGAAGPQRPPLAGPNIASAERASVYSSSGAVAPGPALNSERNSYYADKTKSISSAAGIAGASSLRDGAGTAADGSSMRSGTIGHSKSDSVSGSIGSPLASPREATPSMSGKLSRKGSGWTKGELDEEQGSKVDDDANEAGSGAEPQTGDGGLQSEEAKGEGRQADVDDLEAVNSVVDAS